MEVDVEGVWQVGGKIHQWLLYLCRLFDPRDREGYDDDNDGNRSRSCLFSIESINYKYINIIQGLARLNLLP